MVVSNQIEVTEYRSLGYKIQAACTYRDIREILYGGNKG